MGLATIEKKSLGYFLLNVWVRFWHNVFFYKKFIVLGSENIPIDKPLIFTPNHQNALMDALALLFSMNKILVFIARSDIFSKPAIARILYFLKLLPIYRVRDGYDSIKKNHDIILKTIDVITSGCGLVILPEGNHSDLRRLRPLKKGFARMAFQTEEANGFNLDIHIVPVGIDYNHYQNYKSSPILIFGEPIPVKDYIDSYKENPAIAINNIKDRLSEHIKVLIVDIESEDNYDLYNELRVIYRTQMALKLKIDPKDVRNRVFIDQQLIKSVSDHEKENPGSLNGFQDIILQFVKLRNQLGITNSIIEQKGMSFVKLLFNSVILLVTLPIFLYGFLNNIIPYWLPIKLSRLMKDPQFQSSFKFAISLLTFPIFYIIQCLSVLLIFSDWELVIIYFISLPITGSIAWWWSDIFINTRIGFTYRIMNFKKTKDFSQMLKLYNEIIHRANTIVSNK